jgi:hypothetical protein
MLNIGHIEQVFRTKAEELLSAVSPDNVLLRHMRNVHEILEELLGDQNLCFYVHFDKLTCTQSSLKAGAH